MRNFVDVLKLIVQIALAGLFCLAMLFWVSVAFYCLRGFATSGASGVTGWLMHIAAQPSGTSQIPEIPDWNVIGLRFAGVAAITLVLWFANRRLLTSLRGELRDYVRSLRNPPSGTPGVPQEPKSPRL